MKVVELHEAESDLSRLVEGALAGEPFVIAKCGRPLVRVTAVSDAERRPARTGFLRGRITVPDDFDSMGAEEIAETFERR